MEGLIGPYREAGVPPERRPVQRGLESRLAASWRQCRPSVQPRITRLSGKRRPLPRLIETVKVRFHRGRLLPSVVNHEGVCGIGAICRCLPLVICIAAAASSSRLSLVLFSARNFSPFSVAESAMVVRGARVNAGPERGQNRLRRMEGFMSGSRTLGHRFARVQTRSSSPSTIFPSASVPPG